MTLPAVAKAGNRFAKIREEKTAARSPILRSVISSSARQNAVDNAQRCFDFACSCSDPNNESIFTILCVRRNARGLERLRHRERPGHLEPAGEAFRPAIDCRELARAGSL